MAPSALRIIIADDEQPARRRLQDLVARRDDVVVAAVCTTGREAVTAIEEHEPDLALLDVQMPGLSGFDVVEAVDPQQMPLTIFITAYDQHALQAFNVAAVDYLLKPFEDERFNEAIDRARRRIQLEAVDAARDRLIDLLDATRTASSASSNPGSAETTPSRSPNGKDGTAPAPDAPESAGEDNGYLRRIPVRKSKEIRIVPASTVAYMQSDGPYAELYTADGSKHLIRESMKALENQLDPSQFCRIHRSTIINLDFVESVEPNYQDRYVVRLVTGERLDVSRRRRDTFEDAFGLSF